MKTIEKDNLKEIVRNLSELDDNGRALVESGIRLLIARQHMEERKEEEK